MYIKKESYCRSKRLFQNAAWFWVLFCFNRQKHLEIKYSQPQQEQVPGPALQWPLTSQGAALPRVLQGRKDVDCAIDPAGMGLPTAPERVESVAVQEFLPNWDILLDPDGILNTRSLCQTTQLSKKKMFNH